MHWLWVQITVVIDVAVYTLHLRAVRQNGSAVPSILFPPHQLLPSCHLLPPPLYPSFSRSLFGSFLSETIISVEKRQKP